IIGAVSRDSSQPGSKTRDVAESMELAQRREKHLLDEVIHFARRDSCEKNAVDHTCIPGVQATESGTIAVAGCADKRVILARFGDRPDSHSLTFHACGSKVNAVSHVQAV